MIEDMINSLMNKGKYVILDGNNESARIDFAFFGFTAEGAEYRLRIKGVSNYEYHKTITLEPSDFDPPSNCLLELKDMLVVVLGSGIDDYNSFLDKLSVKYPDTCTRCGAPAYIGLTTVECSRCGIY